MRTTRTRPSESTVVNACRPSGVVLVKRWMFAWNTVRHNSPLTRVESICWMMANGLVESDRVVVRRLVTTDESFDGSRTTSRPGNGTCAPYRGSPLRVTIIRVPSGERVLSTPDGAR